jgi:uncharacterized protein (TIGR02217 family)
MNFHDVRFPASISFGSMGGIERRTEIVELVSGHEERNSPWAHSRRRYDAGLGVRSLDDLDSVLAFFEARRGRLYGFRWKDWLDHKSCAPSGQPAPTDQKLAAASLPTTRWTLTKTYFDPAGSYARPIAKPVAATVRVAVDGVELMPGADFVVNPATGDVEMAVAPPIGAAVTAGFEFDVAVRFDTDVIEVNLAAFEAGEIPSIPIIEVRL